MKTLTSLQKSALDVAFEMLGPNQIARICGVKGPSACKWKAKGRLPRTEWTGETNYADLIAAATKNFVTKEQLLTVTRPAVNGSE